MVKMRLWRFIENLKTKREISYNLMMKKGLLSFEEFLEGLQSVIVADFAYFFKESKFSVS